MSGERVQVHEGGEWTCLCGNTEAHDGFDECDSKGARREPTDGWEGHYRCAGCLRIIDSEGAVVGRAPKVPTLDLETLFNNIGAAPEMDAEVSALQAVAREVHALLTPAQWAEACQKLRATIEEAQQWADDQG